MDTPYIIETRDLVKTFNKHTAVDHINFNIPKGSIFGLLGPNGAGKTTLIRMITGIFHPDSGHILFDGKPTDPLENALHIGYMPEERGLYKKMKVGEQALYLSSLKGLDKPTAQKNIADWFDRLGMHEWWNKKVEDLSKGMSQKLQFVITVAHNPSLIILDEPFSGLDPVNANLIKDEIYRLAKLGSTIIFSTHRMEQVEEICQQIMLVNQGKKILEGDVPSIRASFRENRFRIEWDQGDFPTQDAPFTMISIGEGKALIQKKEDTANNAILSYLIEKGLAIRAFHEVYPTLNDIFIRLVGSGHSSLKSEMPS
ncbi:MAG: ABC transporter ATP-binding protein [Ferruginibacter sp.]